jgi:Fur family ferric uptake transcriptional regulator
MAHLGKAEASDLLERFRRYLRDHHLPATRQRELIAETVFRAQDHLSADTIRRRLQEQGERVATATIYRALDLLERSGLIRAHDFGDGFRRFEGVLPQTGHGHLVCLRCGQVAEFTNERLERMLPIIADEHEFLHQRHGVEIHGLCRDCRRRDLEAL